jgi:hypothetical protein
MLAGARPSSFWKVGVIKAIATPGSAWDLRRYGSGADGLATLSWGYGPTGLRTIQRRLHVRSGSMIWRPCRPRDEGI